MTNKPGTEGYNKYLYGLYRLDQSFIISDDARDIAWGEKLKISGIFLGKANKNAVLCTLEWSQIYHYLQAVPRKVTVGRKTRETDVQLTLNLDGERKLAFVTGLGFFGSYVEQIEKHGSLDLEMTVKGDLETDQHHTMEDVALALGKRSKRRWE